MSELQLGLLVIGVTVVVAVLAYNKWQELRYRKLAERSFGAGHEDVLMGSSGRGTVGAEAPVPDSAIEERVEPRFEPTEPAEAAPYEAAAPIEEPVPAAPAVLAEAIDCIVEIEARQPVQSTSAIERAAALLKNFSRPVHLELWSEAGAAWTPMQHGQSGMRLRAGLQLADRRGMTASEEITRFGRAVQQLATELGARAAAADIAQAGRKSQALDGFCAEVDIQIALNVLAADQAFRGPELRDFAASTGFVLEDDGRFRVRDQAGRELCALANAENAAFVRGSLDNLSTSAVTFELDVPRVPGDLQAFDACAAVAQQFAAAMNGRLADDNQAPLNAAGLAAIRSQLEPVYAAMATQGIPAGSPQALRLFS